MLLRRQQLYFWRASSPKMLKSIINSSILNSNVYGLHSSCMHLSMDGNGKVKRADDAFDLFLMMTYIHKNCNNILTVEDSHH